MRRYQMAGLTVESLKKNPALIPLFFCVGLGTCGAVAYLLRLAIRSPDVSWSPSKHLEPWEEYRTKQYKFYSPNKIDYSVCPAPKY